MEKKFYEAPMLETLELNVKTVILGASDPDILEEPSMGGSDAGYTDPGTFKP